MSLARQCDRCGGFYIPETICFKGDRGQAYNAIKLLGSDFENGYFSRRIFDLCPECLESFENWFCIEEMSND